MQTAATTDREAPFDPNLECAVCNDIFFRPISLHCGHTYCKVCLQNILKTKPQCPLCKAPCFLQQKNLKENVTLKNHIESAYPEHYKRREQMLEEKKEEVKVREGEEENNNDSNAFNPMVILPLITPLEKVVFPGSSRELTVKIPCDPAILQGMCNDKKFLAVPFSVIQDKASEKTVIFEFSTFKEVSTEKGLYKVKARACERVLVNEYTNLDIDTEALQKLGFESQENVTLQIGKGVFVKDHNVGTRRRIEEQVKYLEEYMNLRLAQWSVGSPNNVRYMMREMRSAFKRSVNPTMVYYVDFSLSLARVIRCSEDDKRRMFETTNTLERLLVLKGITDSFGDTTEFGKIIDVDVPGHHIFKSLGSALLLLIVILVALAFYSNQKLASKPFNFKR